MSVDIEHQCDIGIHPKAVVLKDRANRVLVARRNRFLQSEIGGEHLHARTQLVAATCQVLVDYRCADAQRLMRTFVDVPLDGAHDGKYCHELGQRQRHK